MTKGKTWPSEKRIFKDAITGVSITQLTSYLSHHFHLYFTNDGFYDDGRRLLIGSERENALNLYSLHMESGELTQLTDLSPSAAKGIQGTYINPQRHEAYFTLDQSIIALNLDTYEEHSLFTLPDGYDFSNLSVTADGRTICFALSEDVSDRIAANLGQGYGGFEEIEEARPHSQIWVLDIDTKRAKVLHEEQRWIGHVNTSPTQNHILTFCHEGPWEKVDHRIWALNRETGEVWKVRAGDGKQYAGHEYWHADGVRIGYHGFTESIERADGKFIGSIQFDNAGAEEYAFPYQNMHIHSNDAELIIGDGQQSSAYPGGTDQDYIFIWKKEQDRMNGPRRLCRHRGSFQTQHVHVHPRFSPDRSHVLFTSDMSGYGQVYVAEVPDFASLPLVEQAER